MEASGIWGGEVFQDGLVRSLHDIETVDDLGRILGENYHGIGRGLLGGAMGGFESPRAPHFYVWHVGIDGVAEDWITQTEAGQNWFNNSVSDKWKNFEEVAQMAYGNNYSFASFCNMTELQDIPLPPPVPPSSMPSFAPSSEVPQKSLNNSGLVPYFVGAALLVTALAATAAIYKYACKKIAIEIEDDAPPQDVTRKPSSAAKSANTAQVAPTNNNDIGMV